MKISTWVYIVMIVLGFGIAGYLLFHYNVLGSEPALAITSYFDKAGHLINGDVQATIGGVNGVSAIGLTANAKNTDTVPLTFTLIDASPPSFRTAIMTSNLSKTAQAGATSSFVSGPVDITSMVNTNQTFCVTIRASATNRMSVDKQSCITFEILNDPAAGFDVNLASGSNASSNPNPDTELPPAANNTTPTVLFQTNAVGGTYSSYSTGTWVRVDTNADGVLNEYSYASQITSGACTGTQLTTTPEGYAVKYYQGSGSGNVHICNPSGVGYRNYH